MGPWPTNTGILFWFTVKIWLQVSFNNFVDQILPDFDPSSFEWTIVNILQDTYPLSRDQVQTYYRPPPPHLVHVVIE